MGNHFWKHPLQAEQCGNIVTKLKINLSSPKLNKVFILVRDTLICSEQPQLRTECEITWVKLEIVGSQPLYLAAFYKPCEDDQDSLDMLKNSLDKLNGKKGTIMVVGDFNLPKFTWTDCEPSIRPDCSCGPVYDSFVEILDDFNLVQTVTQPTRNDNVLDLILTSNPTLVSKIECLPGLSDHDIVSAEVALKPTQAKQKRRTIHLYNKADWTTFQSKLKAYQTKFLSEHHGRSVEQLWSDITDTLDQLTDQCIPKKVIKGKPSLPWISREIKQQITKRNRFYKAYRKTGNSQLREKYVSLRHAIKKSIKDRHEAYLEGLLGMDRQENQATGQTDSKKLFQYLKNSRTDQQGIPPLKQNDNLHIETKDKADILNQQFQSVFTPLAPLSLKQLSLMKVQDLVDDKVISPHAVPEDQRNSTPIMPSIKISDMSEAGIVNLLKNLKPKKAAGPDRIKPVVLQELREELAPILQVLFERSLQSGAVPLIWNSANVSPIFKKGEKSTAANYRPISLTCILCKVMEHIIASNVVKHLDSNGLMYDLQHGFRERRSCETQLISLIEDLARKTSQKKQTDLILLDFSKAFDKVNHSKLHSYGIRKETLSWIQAFLSNRQQKVVIEGEESDSVPVTSGVPQGSVLGPILFLAYINDLPQDVVSQVRLFADDTAIYLTLENKDDSDKLQVDLDRLQAWEAKWDMEFNPSKCQVIRVTASRTLLQTQYILHGQVLEVVSSARYLGVDISSNLNWNTHVDRITANASRSLGFIRRNVKTKSPQIREMAYQSLVRPQLEYSASVWDPHVKEQIKKIEMVQRRAARWTLNDYARSSSVTQMLNQLNWQTLEERRSVARLCLFYKIVNGLVAVPIPDYIQPSHRISRYCHSMTFRQIHTGKDYYKYSFFPLAVVQWNALPANVVVSPSLEMFKAAIGELHHPKP